VKGSPGATESSINFAWRTSYSSLRNFARKTISTVRAWAKVVPDWPPRDSADGRYWGGWRSVRRLDIDRLVVEDGVAGGYVHQFAAHHENASLRQARNMRPVDLAVAAVFRHRHESGGRLFHDSVDSC
jgi:hypothetical protein